MQKYRCQTRIYVHVSYHTRIYTTYSGIIVGLFLFYKILGSTWAFFVNLANNTAERQNISIPRSVQAQVGQNVVEP